MYKRRRECGKRNGLTKRKRSEGCTREEELIKKGGKRKTESKEEIEGELYKRKRVHKKGID